MRIAICDDNNNDRKILSEHILSYAEKHLLDIEIEKFPSGEALLDSFSDFPFQMVFLDIYLEGISGIEIAFKIREKDENCIIIFVTTSPDFRAEGFEVGAVHYLLKPAAYERVETALNRCRRFFDEAEKCFEITVERRIVKVRIRDVIYAEVYGKTVLIHTIAGILKTYTTLSEIANLLEGEPFLICHRCYIVNMKFVSELLEADFLMENGEKIPIRKNGRQKIKDEYLQYIFNIIRKREDGFRTNK